MESSIKSTRECYFCGTTQNLQRHHCMNGAGRDAAEKYGLWVWLCAKHHEEVHRTFEEREALKIIAEKEFLKRYSFEKWMAIFKKNYVPGL